MHPWALVQDTVTQDSPEDEQTVDGVYEPLIPGYIDI